MRSLKEPLYYCELTAQCRGRDEFQKNNRQLNCTVLGILAKLSQTFAVGLVEGVQNAFLAAV